MIKFIKRLIYIIYKTSNLFLLYIVNFLSKFNVPITKNNYKILKYKNMYRGKRCFIIGNGPSLKPEDLARLKGEFTYLLLFQYAQFRVILNQQVKLSRRLFEEYLTKPYTFHLQRNTADLLRNINDEVPKVFQGIIISGFQLFTEILVTACILLLLFLTAPLATLTASLLLGGSVFIFFKFFRKKLVI